MVQANSLRREKRGFLWEISHHRTLYLMCVPGLLLLLLFCYIPMPGIWMAFVKFNAVDGVFGSPFVGLENFAYFFGGSGKGWQVIFNTLLINFWGILLGLVFPITIAVCMNDVKSRAIKKVCQSAMFFPYFLSWVVVGAIIYGFFASDVGQVNVILKALGKQPVRWYAEPQHWRTIIIMADVWKWSGYSSIVYMAAMANFDGSLYEAAAIDGANRLRQIIHLTIPMLKPTAVVLTLMSVGRIFYGDFGMIYGIVGNNPVLSDEVTVIDTYVYSSMRSLGFGYSTAIGLFQSVMGLILVTLANKAAKRFNDGEGLF